MKAILFVLLALNLVFALSFLTGIGSMSYYWFIPPVIGLFFSMFYISKNKKAESTILPVVVICFSIACLGTNVFVYFLSNLMGPQ